MKKMLSIILILAMLFSFASCGQTNTANKSGDEEQGEGSLATSYKCPAELENKMGLAEEEYAEMLKAYGLAGKVWHEYPTTATDYEDNFLLAYLCGNWKLDTEKYNGVYSLWKKHLGSAGEFASIYPALLGEWQNCFDCDAYFGSDGCCYIYTNGEIPYYTQDEMASHVIETYKAAVDLRNQFHEYVNKINRNISTDLDIAQAYYDFLVANIKVSKNQINPVEQAYRDSHPEIGDVDFSEYIEQHTEASIISIVMDGAYNLLINNRGECCPHACLFNLMLNMEGFETYGLCGSDTGGGHIVSYFIADGQTYLCDWINKRGICALNDSASKLGFVPMEYSLKNVEMTRFHGDLSKVGKEYYGDYNW